jgi:[acyl-carrier-protein] S-malonyltransferase
MPAVTGPRAIAFPGQGGDWRAAVEILRSQPADPLVLALADRLGTADWDALDGLDTAIAQPVIYVAGLVGPARDTDATLAMGHSLGEITAAAWAGAMAPEAGLDLMVARGALGAAGQAQRPGAMVAINRWHADEVDWLRRTVQAELGGVLDVAVTNSPTQIVLSGDAALVDAALERANDAGAVARRLPIGGAYHSTLMAPAVDGFRLAVRAAVSAAPRVPVLSSTSQRLLDDPDDLVEGLTRSLVLAVDWPATVAAAVATGCTRAIEAGPGDTLSRLARFAPDLAIDHP